MRSGSADQTDLSTRALTVEGLPQGGFIVYDARGHLSGFRSYLAAFSHLSDALVFVDREMRFSRPPQKS